MYGFFPEYFWPLAAYTTDTSVTPASIIAYFIINSLSMMTTPTDGEDWPLYSPHMPDGASVKTDCGVVFNTTGIKDTRSIRDGGMVEHPGIQIQIRTKDHDEGYAKIEDISLALDEVINETVIMGSDSYVIQNVSRTSPIAYLGVESITTKRRMFFSVNYLLTLKKL